jgi:hypothetical protein
MVERFTTGSIFIRTTRIGRGLPREMGQAWIDPQVYQRWPAAEHTTFEALAAKEK